jgi:hypothetical protein
MKSSLVFETESRAETHWSRGLDHCYILQDMITASLDMFKTSVCNIKFNQFCTLIGITTIYKFICGGRGPSSGPGAVSAWAHMITFGGYI